MKNYLCITLFLTLLFSFNSYSQSDSLILKNSGSALLEMKSSDKGVLIPRLPSSSRTIIPDPATGLLVYDTTLKEFCYYDGTQWICGWNKGGSTEIDTCFTLDDGYDCDVPGGGALITVDAGAVELDGSMNAPFGTLDVSNEGTGYVAKFVDEPPGGGGTETSITLGQDMGTAALFEMLGAANVNDVVHSYTNGTGRAGLFEITNGASTADALEGYNLGLRHGVAGFTGLKFPLIPGSTFTIDGQPASGVMGMSTTLEKRKGTSGVSIASDGVWGRSFAGGSGYATYDNMDTIIAGVHGSMRSLFSPSESKDFLGVFGITSHNGSGVMGIGGGTGLANRGHGIIGISGAEIVTPSTNAGVWGVTREGTSWDDLRTRFPLDEEDNNKIQVGLLGQSCNYVSVWGESLSKIGVVGTTTTRKSFADLGTMVAGVYGETDTLGFGTVGKSNAEMLESSGVLAIGNADKDKAQALTIHDGAIRVTKAMAPDTPADKISLAIPWTEIFSCTSGCANDPGDCGHEHKIGFEGLVEITNIYADSDRSVILLTPEYPGPGFSANIASIMDGSFFVNVQFYKPEAHCTNQGLPNPVTIHYMIVNK